MDFGSKQRHKIDYTANFRLRHVLLAIKINIFKQKIYKIYESCPFFASIWGARLVPKEKFFSKSAKNREIIFLYFIHNPLDTTLKYFSECLTMFIFYLHLFRYLSLKIYKILAKFRIKEVEKWGKNHPKFLFEVQKTRYLWRYIGICHIKTYNNS